MSKVVLVLAVVTLLSASCGSIDAERPTCEPGTSCSSCPDIDNPHFGGYPCSAEGTPGDVDMMCGIIDSTKPTNYDQATGRYSYTFTKQNSGCYAFMADRVTKVNCVASCAP